MSMNGGHGWGFCEAKANLPEILFQRVVNCYISTVYYAGVAMVGRRFQKETEVISVDAWKSAFQAEDILDAFKFFFCDALPKNYEQIVADEIRKHPLRNKPPATIPLSSAAAKIHWSAFANKFVKLEKEVEEWATANIEKLPNALPNFDIDKMFEGLEDIEEWDEDG